MAIVNLRISDNPNPQVIESYQRCILLRESQYDGVNNKDWFFKFSAWSTFANFGPRGYWSYLDLAIALEYVPRVSNNPQNLDVTTYSGKMANDWWVCTMTYAIYQECGGWTYGNATTNDGKGFDHSLDISKVYSTRGVGITTGKNLWGWFYNWASGNRADYRKIFNYDTRVFDSLFMSIRMKNVETSGKAGDVVWVDQYWDFVPTYTPHNARLDKEGLWIWYDAGYRWNRVDDRYSVHGELWSDKNVKICNAERTVWGTVDWAGRILIPYEKLTAIPAPGDHIITGVIRFNAVWKQIGEEFAYMNLEDVLTEGEPGIPMEVVGECNTPGVEGSVDQLGRVHLRVWDTMDKDAEIVEYEVRLVSDRTLTGLDRYHGTKTDITFYEPPWGEPLVYMVIGFNENGEPSNYVTIRFDPIEPVDMEGKFRFTSNEENPRQIVLRYNVSTTENRQPMVTTVKMAGRDYESAFFGDGLSGTYNLDGVMVVDTSVFNRDMGEVKEEDVYSILLGHPCWVRKADGERDYVVVTDVSVNYARTVPWVFKVSISCKKVA